MSSRKPSKVRNRLYTSPHHIKSKVVRARLSEDLINEYGQHTVRVKKGDGVKIMRGEYSGVEAKVSAVHVNTSRLDVAGIKQEKITGGEAQVGIHSSKVLITTLNLDDDWRKKRLQDKK